MHTGSHAKRTSWFWIVASLGAVCLAPAAGCGGGSEVTFSTSSGSSSGGSGGGTGGGTTSTTGSGGTGDTGGSGGSGGGAVCGDGVVEGTEECDDGNLTSGDGCDNDCSFTCIAGDPSRDHCDDGNPCNGTETCGDDHACHPGTSLGEGMACDTGKICIADNCVDESCGDGLVGGSEECDDGNATSGDGCEGSCTFSCLSTDPARNCASADPCVGDGTCDDATHVCTAGAPATDGTACGSGQICVGGSCVAEQCGDGLVSGSEECDDGNPASGDGCEMGCTFTCLSTDPARDCKSTDPCVADGKCDDVAHTCSAGAPLPDGSSCGSGQICVGGSCVGQQCGDGLVSAGEQCDFGPGNAAGSGCELNCTFSCTTVPNGCDDGDPCNGAETCGQVMGPNGSIGQQCAPGTPLADDTSCGTGKYCKGGVCTAAVCGNGKVEPGEPCDDGNPTNGDGCDTDCTFSCSNPATDCSATAPACDTWQCNGTTHVCEAVADPTKDGSSCPGGAGFTCKNGTCSAPTAVCGNGVKETGEACDLGAMNGTGAGCSSTCQLDCTTNANCSDGDACDGAETCVNATVSGQQVKKCQAGTPATNGTACGTGAICLSGQCKNSICGDGFVDAAKGEACDLAAQNGTGAGCSVTCQLDCSTNTDCSDGNVCNGAEACVSATVNGQAVKKCQAGTSAAKCTACTGGVCNGSGQCTASTCGDGCVDTTKGEACDLAAQNGTGAGCSATCALDCATNADCADGNVCNGGETCVNATVNGQAVKKCQAGTSAAKCTACTGGVCNGTGACGASTCGDGCVDASKGETCDPPNGTSCTSTCQAAAVCGNGVLEAGEQCDDGNEFNLDGCDSNCKYEVVGRMTSLAIQGTAAPAAMGCTPATNRLGTQSLTSTALNNINQTLTDGINNGTTNILTQLLGLDDLTGVADPNGLTLGVLAGTLDPAKGAWPGNNPIDWWFIVDHTTVDSMGLPTGLLTNGTLAARALKAGPNDVNLALLLGGSPANLRMRGTRIAATLNGTPAPNVPAPPPSQLASGLTVFQTVTGSGTGQGLCGNITVESLAQIPIPESLTTGFTACGNCTGSKKYTYCGANMPVNDTCNSLLDALVGGCKVVLCSTTAITPQQPDVKGSDNDIDTLTLGTGNKVPPNLVTGNDDAYSAYMKFDANRAHITGESCTATADCQTGKTCTNGTCQ